MLRTTICHFKLDERRLGVAFCDSILPCLAGQYKHEMNEHKLKLKTELIRHGIQQKDVAQRAGASNTSVHAFLYETVRMSEELQTDIENAIKLLLEEAKRGSGSANR